jgi:hypothetical protein
MGTASNGGRTLQIDGSNGRYVRIGRVGNGVGAIDFAIPNGVFGEHSVAVCQQNPTSSHTKVVERVSLSRICSNGATPEDTVLEWGATGFFEFPGGFTRYGGKIF